GAFQNGQGNEAMNRVAWFKRRSHGTDSIFHSAIARECSPSTVGPIIAPHGGVGKTLNMRVLLAWLIVLVAFVGSAATCAIWGSRKVAAHVQIETSCMLLDVAEKEGWLSRS